MRIGERVAAEREMPRGAHGGRGGAAQRHGALHVRLDRGGHELTRHTPAHVSAHALHPVPDATQRYLLTVSVNQQRQHSPLQKYDTNLRASSDGG